MSRRLRRLTTSRRSRTTSTSPSPGAELVAQRRGGERNRDALIRLVSISHSSSRRAPSPVNFERRQGRTAAGGRGGPRARTPSSAARLGLATRMRPSGVASATPSGIDSRICPANAVGASSEKPKRCMLHVTSAPNTANDATPRRGSWMPSSGSRPSVVEPISNGMPMPVPSHGVWRVSAGDPPLLAQVRDGREDSRRRRQHRERVPEPVGGSGNVRVAPRHAHPSVR